jgi:hypothetical protein
MELRHNLLTRDLKNITGPADLKPGYINKAHQSNLTIGWTPASLPTPYSIIIASSIISLIIACIGFKTALLSWARPDDKKVIPEGFKEWSWRRRWKWSRQDQKRSKLRTQAIVQAEIDGVDAPDGVAPQEAHRLTLEHSDDGRVYAVVDRSSRSPTTTWDSGPFDKSIVILSLLYNTARAAFAIAITLEIAITHKGTHAAVSSLFLFFLSIQTFTTNRTFPRLINLILVIDLVLVGAALLVAQWDWRVTHYGDVVVFGGNCPVFASNCTAQAVRWTKVGCGAATKERDWNSRDDLLGAYFNPPYPTGDINTEKGQRKLKFNERAIGIVGSIWVALTLIITIREASRMIGSLRSFRQLLWPIPLQEQLYEDKKTRKLKRRSGWSSLGALSFFGFLGTFIVTGLSIAGHVASRKHPFVGTYIDGFGPAVNTNVTFSDVPRYNGAPQVNSTQYQGNATSWSDCFTVETPRSTNGFFKEWVEHNTQSAYRFVALL